MRIAEEIQCSLYGALLIAFVSSSASTIDDMTED